jgi:ABC-2 type transport system ATP-binding protein
MHDMNEIIQVSQLTKIYPSQKGGMPLRAVDSIDFSVHEGEVFGFLGPNGAGKTTTIRMLTGLIRPSEGHIEIMGMDLFQNLSKIKKGVGIVPDKSNLYDELTAYENLVFDMQLYGVPKLEWKNKADSLLERFGLQDKRNILFAKLSHGMKRALTVSAALAHNPRLIFLDEPTTGLDVMSARRLRKMIANLRKQGVTVFLTTHYLEEAERLCDRIGLIVKGRLVALDTVEGLKNRLHSKAVRVEIVWKDQLNETFTAQVEAECADEAIQTALQKAQGNHVVSINTLQPSLEDVFVQLTGLDAEVMLSEKGNGKGK